MEDDDNHDRANGGFAKARSSCIPACSLQMSTSSFWQKRSQTLESLCELFECYESEDDNAHKNLRRFTTLSLQYRARTQEFEILSKKWQNTLEIDARRLQHRTQILESGNVRILCKEMQRKLLVIATSLCAIAQDPGSVSMIKLRVPQQALDTVYLSRQSLAWEDGLQAQHTRSNGIT